MGWLSRPLVTCMHYDGDARETSATDRVDSVPHLAVPTTRQCARTRAATRSCSVVFVHACRRRPGRAAGTRLELFVIIQLHWVSVLGKT